MSYKLSATDPKASQHGEKGYPWLFFHRSRSRPLGLAVTLIVIGLCGAFYAWYRVSAKDLTPFSATGLWYGVIGTIFLIFAAVLYSLRRRSRKRAIGQLNAALSWHVFFAIMGLAILFMHSFGHFDPISGTFALLGMVVLALSGLVGRILDHLIPRLIAQEVDKVLTSQGDDRIEAVSQSIDLARLRIRALSAGRPWASSSRVLQRRVSSVPCLLWQSRRPGPMIRGQSVGAHVIPQGL